MTHPLDLISDQQRGLLLLDALRIRLALVDGREREEVCRSLREAGMRPHHAADGCESWHWPGHAPLGPCPHGLTYSDEPSS